MSDVSTTSSGLTGAGGGNKMRITGMNTGLDVDAMVKKMMTAEQAKLDKLKQEQERVGWRQEAYLDIIKDIKDLQNSFFDTISTDKNILSSANYAGFDVTGVNSAMANVTAGAGAQVGNYTVNVVNVATTAGLSNSLSGKSLSTKLTDLNATLTDKIELKVNGLTIKLDNSAATGKNGNATLGDLVNAINNQSGGSIKAAYSELTGKFTLNTSATGTAASLTIESGTTAGLSGVLGSYTPDTAIKNGTDAKVNINGTDVIKSSNNFTIDGVNYALTGPGTSTVTVGVNNDKVYDKIKGFIDKYNAVIDKIQTKLSEKKNYSYKPLTDTQRASMKESEITAWETKAKAGVLRNDSNLKNLLDNLRSAFATPVNSTDVSMGKFASNSIGLDFSSDNLKPAHIDITDPAKLKAAIGAKGDQILKFFTNASTSTDKTTAYSESGVFARIKTIMESNVGLTGTSLNNATLTKYANKQDNFSRYGGAGDNTLPDQLYQKQILIDNMKTALAKKEESYYQKFSRLETAMNTLNAQQSQLSQFTSS